EELVHLVGLAVQVVVGDDAVGRRIEDVENREPQAGVAADVSAVVDLDIDADRGERAGELVEDRLERRRVEYRVGVEVLGADEEQADLEPAGLRVRAAIDDRRQMHRRRDAYAGGRDARARGTEAPDAERVRAVFDWRRRAARD